MIDPTKFIDREFEQELFEELLLLRDAARLLAIRDTGGMGKSSLLEKFQYRCRVVAKPRIPVSLLALDQLPDASPLALIRQVVQQLSSVGVEFPQFHKNEGARLAGDFLSIRAFIDLKSASLKGAKDVHIHGVHVERAETVHVSASGTALTTEQETVAQGASIRAFFDDLGLHCAEQTAVIMLDAYDRCAPLLQQWIVEQFLEQMCFDPGQRPVRLVLVLAGREIPMFEQYWPVEDCQGIVRSVKQLSRWQRRHVEECLRVHGFPYDASDIDAFHRLIERHIPPSQVVQLIQTMLGSQRRSV